MLLKINLLVIVPYIFFLEYLRNKRSFKIILVGFFLSSFLIFGINLLIYGPKLLIAYPIFLLTSENIEMGTDPIQNYNPVGILSIITDNKIYMLVGSVVLYLISSALFLSLFKKTKDYDLLYAVALALGVLLNFHTMPTDLVFLTLELILFSNFYFTRAKNDFYGWLKAFGVVILFDLSIYLGVIKLQSATTIILLLFFYFTLRSSIKSTV